jgi:hypothetical protein
MAHFDLARGHYEEQGYGYSNPADTEYARLLHQRYGVEYRQVAQCIVPRRIKAYADAYNGVSVPAAKRKFGRDIFAETFKEADKHWQMKRPQAGPD